MSVDSAGTIDDLNFFMRDGAANADGYSIEGWFPFNFVLCAGSAIALDCSEGVEAVLDSLVITVTDVHGVPEPATLALLGTGLLGTLVSDLVTLIAYLLGGEATLRFLLKVADVAVIALTVITYYLWDLRRAERAP